MWVHKCVFDSSKGPNQRLFHKFISISNPAARDFSPSRTGLLHLGKLGGVINKGRSGPGYMFSRVETLYKDLGTADKSSSNLWRLYVRPGLVFGFLSICSNMAMRAAERSSKGNSSVGGGRGKIV